jgi:hypothetical protein
MQAALIQYFLGLIYFAHYVGKTEEINGKAITVTGREPSRIPHFLENRLTDGCKVVSLTRRLPFAPYEDSWYSFLLKTESIPGS